ncbi:MAG: hypothetical protein ACPG31_05190 [Planctomycetota bacterium]
MAAFDLGHRLEAGYPTIANPLYADIDPLLWHDVRMDLHRAILEAWAKHRSGRFKPKGRPWIYMLMEREDSTVFPNHGLTLLEYERLNKAWATAAVPEDESHAILHEGTFLGLAPSALHQRSSTSVVEAIHASPSSPDVLVEFVYHAGGGANFYYLSFRWTGITWESLGVHCMGVAC